MAIATLLSLLVAAAQPDGASELAAQPAASEPERVGPAPLQAAMETVTFDEAVRRALARSTPVVLAVQEMRRAEALLWQARSDSLPRLDAGGTATQLDAARPPQGAVFIPRQQIGGTLTLTVPLVAPTRWYQWAHGSQAVDAAAASEQDARRSAAIAAARAYLTIIAQRRTLVVAVRARDNARAHYDFAHARLAAGLASSLDEIRAEQQFMANSAQVENTFAALALAREALGILVGGDGPLDAADEPELPTPQEADQALRRAETDRQDVKAARARTYVTERIAADTWSTWLPTILATAQPFYQNPPSVPLPQTGWQAQLVLSWPLFEGGLRVGQSRERNSIAEQARAQLDLLLRQARSEVRVAWETMVRAERAYRDSKRSAERANLALALATRAYRSGAMTNLEVIDAERQARDADTSAVVAEDAVRQSRINLLAAVGRFP